MHSIITFLLRFALLQLFIILSSFNCFAQQSGKTAHTTKQSAVIDTVAKWDKLLPPEPKDYKYSILLDIKTTNYNGDQPTKVVGPIVEGNIISKFEEIRTNNKGDIAYIAVHYRTLLLSFT